MAETDSGSVTQEQLDNAPDYEGSGSTEYTPNQGGAKAPEKEATPAADQAQAQELQFTHNGKPIKATLEQVLKWAQQGYDYPQKMQAFNQQQARFNQERSQWEKQWNPYKQVDDYAKANPNWWNTVKQQWETRGAQPQAQAGQTPQGAQPDPYSQKIQALESKLNEQGQFIQSVQAKEQQQSELQEDHKLDGEIKSIRESFKDIDFDQLDDTGKSLEFKVLEHAYQNGIKSFKTAFRDFYHDQLLARTEQQAKQAVAGEVQKNSRLGILGKSPTPQTSTTFKPTQNIRQKSYNQIDEEVLAELKAKGITLSQ